VIFFVRLAAAAGPLASLSAAVDGNYGGADIAELPKFFRDAMLQDFGK
jgi:hypothetical protein